MVFPQHATALLAAARLVSAAPQFLAPENDINLPSSATATNPLRWLGANGPWAAGPDVFGISSDIPDGCTVDQAAYVSRHASRYPDPGAYDQWTDFYDRIQAANFTASGSLSFMSKWRPVLTNPDLQISMESPTGYKESHDLGYTMRTRYPDLYHEGDPFVVWANNYTRVLQTAEMFVHGFLGPQASTLGSVVSVSGSGFVEATGDTLAPSDMCPNFKDTSGSTQQAQWSNIYIPPIQKRLQAMIKGDLVLTQKDIALIPYLCGFESQITGRLSPWCGVFDDEELKADQYTNDLRYWYGVGPGTDLPAKMMTPYLNALMGVLAQGPNITGTDADGSSFQVPKLLMSFINDGQLIELVTASGVLDGEDPLDPTSKDDGRLFISSRFVCQRGTIAFERLNCRAPTTTPCGSQSKRAVTEVDNGHNTTYVRIRVNEAVYPVPSCQSGPGRSCPLKEYQTYLADKLEAQGNWMSNCNVTKAGAPTEARGASFYTNLAQSWLLKYSA